MKRWQGLICALLPVILGACASTPPAPPPRHGTSTTSARKQVEVLQVLRPQVRSCLDRGDYLSALRLLRGQAATAGAAAGFTEEYDLALRLGMRHGQGLLEKGEFHEGGIRFRRMLDLYPHSLASQCTVSTGQISQRLGDCSNQLMAKGLAEYRAGQLQQAIGTWEALLSFDADRTEAKKAIETCTVQLRNLGQRP